ncbi:hypothetical protein Pyrfu_0510 [Pyrolobus fumarii 1A]|uniref:Uncharacterized protein n=1 Tax=Pyrolobus fumarii (strain DSM 11204 / 1A) TaxID=694429 RepID=G0EGK7_PYRF1|nr:hypothetical protein [Pyrolobus fumarii]AEM38381.1 hypothetical protein Pyrfu_0510 [Pyrolobus fumarii 1A]
MSLVEGQECRSARVDSFRVSKAARLLHEAFVKEARYGPVDKLGLASGPDSLLVALFEVERGVRSVIENVEERRRDEWDSLVEIVEAIASDARRSECVEHALRLAHELAVKALAGGR